MASPLFLGIDPGWSNLGLALLAPKGDKYVNLFSSTYAPGTYKKPEDFVEEIPHIVLKQTTENLVYVTVERYVAYAGVHTVESENINNLIGMIRMKMFLDPGKPAVFLPRAIEWKTFLVKTLAKNLGFSNPSNELDKKFSLAAARFLVTNPETIKNHHEADAICLAVIPDLHQRFGRHGQEKPTQAQAPEPTSGSATPEGKQET